MKSIVLCEGLTDCMFVQYYMRSVYGWIDSGKKAKIGFTRWNRILIKDLEQLIIGHNGGSSGLLSMLEDVFKSNYISQGNELYRKVVLITDRDEDTSEESMISQINDKILLNGGIVKSNLKNNEWIDIVFINSIGEKIIVSFLALVIPLQENGAIETVLLNSIAKKDIYDKEIIDNSKEFVDNSDCEERYLKRRRHKLKAWFNVYFSIRVPEDYYTERQKIFMDFPWEEHPHLRSVFSKLEFLN